MTNKILSQLHELNECGGTCAFCKTTNSEKYDERGNLIYIEWGNGGYSKRTYDKYNEIILDEGIGNKNAKPYWDMWDRVHNEDGTISVHHTSHDGYWQKYTIDKNREYAYDYSNKYHKKVNPEPYKLAKL